MLLKAHIYCGRREVVEPDLWETESKERKPASVRNYAAAPNLGFRVRWMRMSKWHPTAMPRARGRLITWAAFRNPVKNRTSCNEPVEERGRKSRAEQ